MVESCRVGAWAKTEGGGGGFPIDKVAFAGADKKFVGDDLVLTFTAEKIAAQGLEHGSLQVIDGDCDARILLVGGGGGGGLYSTRSLNRGAGGGGGAGGMRELESIEVSEGTKYSVFVGTGGVGSSVNGNGSNGGNSYITSSKDGEEPVVEYVVYGGGGGGGVNTGSNGGSGGGGSKQSSAGPNNGGSPIVPDDGHAGGGTVTGGANYVGAGGGGAGGNGLDGYTDMAAGGGEGRESLITGDSRFYAGGGGGGQVNNSGWAEQKTGGVGGVGGGGNGGGREEAENGTDALGGGGGGGGTVYVDGVKVVRNGGNGGAGVVIVRLSNYRSNIPYDYEVDWIKGDGTSWVDSGFPVTETQSIHFDFQIKANITNLSTATTSTITRPLTGIGEKSSTGFRIVIGTIGARFIAAVDYSIAGSGIAGAVNEVELKCVRNNYEFYINGELIGSGTAGSGSITLTGVSSFPILAGNYGGTISGYNKFMQVHSYYAKNLKTGFEVDLIPVVKDGVAFFYDKISKRLLGNANPAGGELIAGPRKA